MVADPTAVSGGKFDHVPPDDVVIVTSTPQNSEGSRTPQMVSALRYLINRHEISTGTAVPQVIAVVSALGNEGVTTVSRSVADVLSARSLSNICWLDLGDIAGADRRPATPRLMTAGAHDTSDAERAGLTPGGGGRQQARWIERTGDVRPSRDGASRIELPPPASDVDPGAGFDRLLDGLSERYRHVIFDTPPLLAEPDSLGFLMRADAYILVARYGVTTRHHVRKIREELQTIPSLGAVLNGYRTRTPGMFRRFFSE